MAMIPGDATHHLRKIIHLDMDCFYAAVEERDHPEYRGKPLAVGGAAHRRGVLSTCNYPARQRGLHSAMPTRRALALCPELILLPIDMPKYREASRAIHRILKQFTNAIEPLALDEAYLDVTQAPSATRIAQAIKQQIKTQLGLTASAGVAPNKFLAKIASDWRKPDGLMAITPAQVAPFVATLPVEKLFGVGKVTAKKLAQLGIMTCADLQGYSLAQLCHHFGKLGERLYYFCRGIDERPVEPNRFRHSVSVEETFSTDLPNLESAIHRTEELFIALQQRLSRFPDRAIKSQFVKIKFHDFTQTTAECQSRHLDLTIYQRLLAQGFLRQQKSIRLIGLGVHFQKNIESSNSGQQILNWD